MRLIFSKRLWIFVAGTVLLAFGITLNTKTMLGVSPIISIPYSISQISGLDLGVLVFAFYVLYILLQWVLLGRNFQKFQLLQIVNSFMVSAMVSLFNRLLPDVQGAAAQYSLLAAAIVLTGIGAALTVGMRLIPNPADAFADVIGMKLHKNFGFGKNVFDLTCVGVTTTIGLALAGHLIGIGPGTLCAMIFTGRVIAFCGCPVKKLYDGVSEQPDYC